jgi:hypothetical protein
MYVRINTYLSCLESPGTIGLSIVRGVSPQSARPSATLEEPSMEEPEHRPGCSGSSKPAAEVDAAFGELAALNVSFADDPRLDA